MPDRLHHRVESIPVGSRLLRQPLDESHLLAEGGGSPEVHALDRVDVVNGLLWIYCTCGAHSEGFTTRERAATWLCPRQDAEDVIRGNARQLARTLAYVSDRERLR